MTIFCTCSKTLVYNNSALVVLDYYGKKKKKKKTLQCMEPTLYNLLPWITIKRCQDNNVTHLDALLPCVLVWLAAAADIMRKRLAISVKDGLAAGLGAQHCSISVLHS